MKRMAFWFFPWLFCFAPARANNVHYNQTAIVFELMDQLSLWNEHLDPAYRKAWAKRFGALDPKALKRLKKYSTIRRRYSPKIEERSLFSKGGYSLSFFSQAFYSSESVKKALKKLVGKITVEEGHFLSHFYRLEQSKIKELALKEGLLFKGQLDFLKREWGRVKGEVFAKKFADFLNLEKERGGPFQILPLWRPLDQSGAPTLEVRGHFILLRYHPSLGASAWKGEAMLTQVIRQLMAFQSLDQKRKLTQVFEGQCPGRGSELKETLVTLWSQVIPAQKRHRKKFNLYQEWAERPFLDLSVKLMYPLLQEEIRSKGKITGRFIQEATHLCSQLHRLSI